MILQELYDKGVALECVDSLDEHMQSLIRSFLKEKKNTVV